jgi:hypothetical protein
VQLKTCTVCKKELPIDHFYKSQYNKDGFRSECKDCSKSNNKKYYDSHRQQIIDNVTMYVESNKEKVKQYQSQYRQDNFDKLKEHRKEHDINKRKQMDAYKTPCAKCGERRLYVIDFHHIDPSTKSFTIGDSYRGNNDKIEEEIKKCVCLCSNCHREFHYLYGIVPKNPISELEEYLELKLS